MPSSQLEEVHQSMNWKYLLVVGILTVISLTACTEEARKRLEPTPIAIGSINQLAVIADQELWNGPIGDSLNFYFGSAFPILPQPEPLFDLKHFTVEDLHAEPTRKELKAYLIIADLSDETSPTAEMVRNDLGSEKIRRSKEDKSYSTNMGKDRWATDQLLVYIFAHGQEALAEQVVNKFPSIAKVIQDQYENQIDATAYLGGVNHIAINTIREILGCYLKVPIDYQIAVSEDQTIWLKREADMATTNIIIHKTAYKDQSQFSKESIIALRDALGKKYVSSTIEGSYMRTNPVDLPVFVQPTQVGDAYAVEARGIWEMEGDFLGGPFISKLILDEKNQTLFFLDAFTLAPSERKRNFMLSLNHILATFELESASN